MPNSLLSLRLCEASLWDCGSTVFRFMLRGQSIFMAILAADIPLAISAVLPDRAAETPPFSPNPPISYGNFANKLFRSLAVQSISLLSLCLSGKSIGIAMIVAAVRHLRRGGHTGAIRCNCANSADTAEPPAVDQCQFSGISRAIRLPFQRTICNKFPPSFTGYQWSEPANVLMKG